MSRGGAPGGGPAASPGSGCSATGRSPSACGQGRRSPSSGSTRRASAEASNQIVPVATARVSLRIAPEEDPHRARGPLARPPARRRRRGGSRSRSTTGTAGPRATACDNAAPAFDAMRRAMKEAYGRRADRERHRGGSVPLVPMLARTFPGIAEMLIHGRLGRAEPVPLDGRERGPRRPRADRALARRCSLRELGAATTAGAGGASSPERC